MIGLLAGVLKALLGIGGGVIVVPALVFFAGFGQKEAQAASLWYVVPTSLFAGILYAGDGKLDSGLPHVAAMVAAAFVGVLVGAPFVKRIRQRRLKQIFGVSVILIAAIMIWQSVTGDIVPIQKGASAQYLLLALTGLIAGFLSSLLGIGGGVIVVPALVLIGAFDQKVAQGMSLMYIVPVALFSALLYRFHAKIKVDGRQVSLMITAGLAGAYAGWELVTRTPSATLRVVFAGALVLIGVTIITRAKKTSKAGYAPDQVI